MAEREDFRPMIKRLVAERAGYRCSMPDCRRLLIGPSNSDAERSINLGIAAHIHAASPGGPRFSPAQTSEDRVAASNCIYLCPTHATLIDKNGGIDFEASLLRKWKRTQEDWASTRMADGEIDQAEFGKVIWIDGPGGSVSFERAQNVVVNIGNDHSAPTSVSRAQAIKEAKEDHWEYKLFFVTVIDGIRALRRERLRTEGSAILPDGERVQRDDVPTLIIGEFEAVSALVSAIEPILNSLLQRGFGEPGEAGDEDTIEHCGDEIVNVYRGLIEWHGRIGRYRLPSEFASVIRTVRQMALLPLQQIDEWVAELEVLLARWPELEAQADTSDEPVEIRLHLKLSVDDRLVQQLESEFSQVQRRRR